MGHDATFSLISKNEITEIIPSYYDSTPYVALNDADLYYYRNNYTLESAVNKITGYDCDDHVYWIVKKEELPLIIEELKECYWPEDVEQPIKDIETILDTFDFEKNYLLYTSC